MDLGLHDKRALVLGGSAGLGYAIADSLLSEGARVVLGSRSAKNLEKAKEDLAAKHLGSHIEFLPIDLSQESSVVEGIRAALSAGAIDILVVNSGGPKPGPATTVGMAAWDEGYQLLIRSLLTLVENVVPGMEKKKWGRILNITSTSASEIIPTVPISGTFRSGLSALVKHLARELGTRGILINNLLPGPTRTERLQELSHLNPNIIAEFTKEIALKRLAEADEIARVGTFLVSNANSFVTGTDILADGGFTKAI